MIIDDDVVKSIHNGLLYQYSAGLVLNFLLDSPRAFHNSSEMKWYGSFQDVPCDQITKYNGKNILSLILNRNISYFVTPECPDAMKTFLVVILVPLE